MRIFLFLVLAISFSIGSFAQGLPDSTVIAIRISRNDSLRLRSYMEAYTYFRERNRDSAFYYNHLCLQIARKNSESLMEAVCQVRNSLQLTAIGHYAESLSILLEVLQITERLDSKGNTWL